MDRVPGYLDGLGMLCDGVAMPDPLRAELLISSLIASMV